MAEALASLTCRSSSACGRGREGSLASTVGPEYFRLPKGQNVNFGNGIVDGIG